MQFEEAHQYAEDNGLIHMETSAKSAQNVKNIFVEIGECHRALQFTFVLQQVAWYGGSPMYFDPLFSRSWCQEPGTCTRICERKSVVLGGYVGCIARRLHVVPSCCSLKTLLFSVKVHRGEYEPQQLLHLLSEFCLRTVQTSNGVMHARHAPLFTPPLQLIV